jgi:hypothetical protein
VRMVGGVSWSTPAVGCAVVHLLCGPVYAWVSAALLLVVLAGLLVVERPAEPCRDGLGIRRFWAKNRW